MKHIKVRAVLVSLAALAGVGASAAGASAVEGPGHIVLAGNKVAVSTSGRVGSPVTLARFSLRAKGEDWNFSQFANPFGAGEFFYAPGGKQTNDYLVVTARGATLVAGAPKGTIFDSVTVTVKGVKYTVLAIPLPGKGPSKNVLTDDHGKLVIAAEKHGRPSADQEWTIR